MALRIQKRSWVNRDGSVSESWRLIVRTYSGDKFSDHYPPKTEYARYGLDPDDALPAAKVKLKTIQYANRLEQRLERRTKIDARIKLERLKSSAYLPVSLFEKYLEWLRDRRMWEQVPAKTDCHIRCMRKCVLELDLHPSTWPDQPEKIFRWFLKKRYSISYIQKVLPLLNDYGYFYCREFGKPYLPIPAPTKDIVRKIEDANLEEREGDGGASLPIRPAQLETLRAWPDAKLRFMRFSVWFGFRPAEIDQLRPLNRGKVWKVEKDQHGTLILHFYQAKLVRVSRDKRWKRIPCILPEQMELVSELIQGFPIKRPVVKTLERYLGEGHYLYGGRKGFQRLMRGYGQDDRNISRWLGHRDINRTEADYREAEMVEYQLVPKRKTPAPARGQTSRAGQSWAASGSSRA